MFAKYCLSLLARSRPLNTTYLRRFSTHSDRLSKTLQRITVEIDGKNSGLLDSGMVVGQHIDEATKKVTISLNLNKDYRRIKSLIKAEL